MPTNFGIGTLAMGSIMGRLLIIAGLAVAALVAPANAASKLSYGECKVRVTNDPGGRYVVGKSRNRCGHACVAAARRCMASGGKFD